MQWFFLIVSTLSWAIAEIFYKKGNLQNEKYSHLKSTIFVGFAFGIYAIIITIIQTIKDINFLINIPINMLIYLPVALCYIISMTCSYFGVRYIEESISDPIENTSGAIVPILCAIILHEKMSLWSVLAVIIIVCGVLGIGFLENKGNTNRKKILGKKLAILAFSMPFCYALLDACGTFLDIYYTDSITTTLLKGVNENNLEHMANCCYEFIFFIISIGLLIFLKIKKVKLFSVNEEEVLSFNEKILLQKDKIFASIFETIGQATYLFALSEGKGIAAVIIGAGTVILSLILSRIFLKEKLTKFQYIFILIILSGIIILSIFEG